MRDTSSINWFARVWDNPIAKILILAIGILAVVLLIIAVYKAVAGQHVRIFGIELNDPQKKADQVVAPVKTDTVVRFEHDTIHDKPGISEQKRASNKMKVRDTTHHVSSRNQSPIDQKNENGDNQANVNTGTNSGVIGNNNTVNVNPKQHPTKQLLDEIEKTFPDKSAPITLMAVTSGAGSADFAQELQSLMKNQRGYEHVNVGTTTMAPIPPKGLSRGRGSNKNEITLLVNVD